MAFMVPGCEHHTAYVLETNMGSEIVFEDVCGVIDLADIEGLNTEERDETGEREEIAFDHFWQYIEGSTIYSVEKVVGYFSNLSASGYMDQTDYMGPYDTAEEALKEVMDFYEIDENGDDLNEESEQE
jgi:hypothetical protein